MNATFPSPFSVVWTAKSGRVRRPRNRSNPQLPIDARQQVADTISAPANEPRPPGVKKLSGSKSSYRIRVGDYRVLYTIADRVPSVVVVKVDNRRDVYKP